LLPTCSISLSPLPIRIDAPTQADPTSQLAINRIALTEPAGGFLERHSQYVHPKHPPDKQNRDECPRDVNDPIASGFGFPKTEHAAMVAGPAQVALHPEYAQNRLRQGKMSVNAFHGKAGRSQVDSVLVL
jgi:hypothetical protein